jgi:hypothetical protein
MCRHQLLGAVCSFSSYPGSQNSEFHAELLHFCQNTETSGRRPHKIINGLSVHWLQVNVDEKLHAAAPLAPLSLVRRTSGNEELGKILLHYYYY